VSAAPGRILVVNADDGGVDEARNEGILEAVDRGVVRSVSVLAQGAALEGLAAALRRRPGVGVGLHLNLPHGAPLGGPARTLTGGDGRFPKDKREVWARAAAGRLDPAEAAREVRAQLALLRSLGIEPDHLDGHNHVHVLPGVREGVARVLHEEPGIRWVRTLRLPAGTAGPAGFPRELAAWDAEATRSLPPGVRGPDAFLGLDYFLGGDRAALEAEIRAAPGTVVECMVHPGRTAAGSVPFSADPRREAEMRDLCSPSLRGVIGAAGFAPGSFLDAAALRTG